MPERCRPEVMIRQALALADDVRLLTAPCGRRAGELLSPAEWATVRNVHLTGDGDSYHAARAAESAFRAFAAVDCRPWSALRLLEYGPRPTAGPGRDLVVAVSASGRTERVLQAVARCRASGALTVGVTAGAGSPLTETAERTLLIRPPVLEPSPGIRTYQSSLLGLLLIAVALGEGRGALDAPAAGRLRRELADLAGPVDTTVRSTSGAGRALGGELADAPAILLAGSGPGQGTALFCAAKIMEGAGVPAAGQDLEEWCHVERFASPADLPLIVLAPPGRTRRNARAVAVRARDLGRRVVAVVPHESCGTEWTEREAGTVLPVHGDVREEFAPLLYHLFVHHVTAALALRLGREPFEGGRATASVTAPGRKKGGRAH
ncbi:Glutamine--fructose-6-phosphate aminotransferase [isomerizing] [Streptomyces sp. ADI96-02]|uniref:SIS domain-containing protein n=1 Tax=unclassified Streptomyces TaxID=2593676 RepID=UPI000F558CC0|nr:SIS domain-containing protein [Streptomyces sp. ADI96-02]RPK54733.1 Glutamine--fructose-6-phosphate aminotransferase [isomerizing] [Streptomyces sp. ADI96-02]